MFHDESETLLQISAVDLYALGQMGDLQTLEEIYRAPEFTFALFTPCSSLLEDRNTVSN